ncbi:predicted protein [Plenodomus lingam JN3]|uniref:Predicted protein n=1 Tax=Leptosphaeria maculans (strain JN3 / isolate v23.1.3 / race Av1-4-5-6-7-8) TaxID=985895 RepID=E5A8C9_LEPMJ|nr:predicted protein [Plenodomus lingam JN3]CBX99874.1 predicted protein [Plenodomus lingam JN3]
MAILNFTLTPEAAAKVHDLLVCLGRFDDTVLLEARREKLVSAYFHGSELVQNYICRYLP